MQSESERTTAEEERETPPKKSLVYVVLKVLFCVIKHLFCGSSPLTSSSFLPPDPRTLLHWCRKPGTRKPVLRHHATRDVEGVIDLVVLEQFITRLPRRKAEWVRCHRPTSLGQAIQLAEDHLAACPGVGEPRPNLSLSLSSPFPSISFSLSPSPSSQVAAASGPSSPATEWEWTERPLPPARGGGQSPPPLHSTLSGNPLPTLLPRGRR